MPRESIQPGDVFAAARALEEQGQTPTIEKVRGLLGRGSHSTIAPLLRRYKEEGTVAPVQELRLGGPEGQLEGFLGRVVAELRSEAEREIGAVRARAQAQVSELEQQLAELHDAHARVRAEDERRLAAAVAAREALEASYNELCHRVDSLRSEYTQESGELRASLRAEHERAHERAMRLQQELHAHGQLHAQRYDRLGRASEELVGLLEAQHEQTTRALLPLSDELPRARAHSTELEHQLERERRARDDAQRVERDALRRASEAESALAQLRIERDQLDVEVTAQRAELSSLNERLQSSRSLRLRDHQEFEARLARMRLELMRLRRRRARLTPSEGAHLS